MIQIDADDGAVRVELPHGEAATIEGLRPGIPIERGTQRALFLEQEEAETLGKMIDYVLENVRIRPESADNLRAVRPRLEQLFGDGSEE
ncbi:MAG: hypothetical protein JOZ81_04690 [Chloroflexi bacterium]|nr:hypothetical protein [Chloroflexota bacterium]